MKEKTLKLIENRIKDLQKIRDGLTQSGNSRTKYNFIIGEMQSLLLDIEDLK